MDPAAFEAEARRLREALPYEAPVKGTHYWVKDGILPNAKAVARRCFEHKEWQLGFPHRPEYWPGKRFAGALTRAEMAGVESWVKATLGCKALEYRRSEDGGMLSSNYAQLVGEQESGPRPHTDSRALCTHAAVIYLQPRVPEGKGGTAFFRLQLPDGTLGGNVCPPPHTHLTTALNVKKLPLQAWKLDVEVPNVFNRIFLYRSDLVHSASSYFGEKDRDKRLTALFFWWAVF
ncbi:MAG TPA: hypothetical protein VND93_16775 [Myxococcales bacterium]|jgi:hypothetical protein|nr:hypothetical protein [Myxococcales bacterium]